MPDKNIRPLGGKPLIAWSIEHALAVKRIARVIVSTDSEEIAAVARDYGAEVPFIRPAELASDDSPEWLAWRHALNYLLEKDGVLPDVMVSVPVTAPLRLALDIENCLEEYEKGDADMVITVTDAHRSPYFNMVKTNADGTVGLVIPPQSTRPKMRPLPPKLPPRLQGLMVRMVIPTAKWGLRIFLTCWKNAPVPICFWALGRGLACTTPPMTLTTRPPPLAHPFLQGWWNARSHWGKNTVQNDDFTR